MVAIHLNLTCYIFYKMRLNIDFIFERDRLEYKYHFGKHLTVIRSV